MYKIVGADGREYGPADAGQVQRWIVEGRANAQSHALAPGATEWKPLGALPEFAACFAPPLPPRIRPLPGATYRKTSSYATAGLVCGILSLFFCCCYGFPFNILGLIFSLIGLVQIRRHPESYDGQGLAIAGLILSLASFVLYAILLVIGLASGTTNFQWHMGTN